MTPYPMNLEIVNGLVDAGLLVQYQYSQCYRCLPFNVSVPRAANNTRWLALWPHYTAMATVMGTGGRGSPVPCSATWAVQEDTNYSLRVGYDSGNTSLLNCTVGPATPDVSLTYLLPALVLAVLLCLASATYYALLMMYRHRVFQRVGSRLFLYQIDSLEDLGNPRRGHVPGGVATDDGGTDDTDEDGASLYRQRQAGASSSPAAVVKGGRQGNKRIKAVDTMRGLSVVLMVLVNYGGGQYWFLIHSRWNGVTLADLVFPWFVFVMGVTVALSLFKLSLGRLKKLFVLNIWLRAVKRSAILFLIGVALGNQNGASLATLRVMGPLQRLAIAYLALLSCICTVAMLQRCCHRCRRCCSRRRDGYRCCSHWSWCCQCCCRGHANSSDTVPSMASVANGNGLGDRLLVSTDINTLATVLGGESRLRRHLPDLVKCWPHILVAMVLLAVHACVSLLVVIDPRCPRGYLGPGGLADRGQFPNCTGGVAAAIDRAILSPAHMYQTPTCAALYKTTQPFDPEGFLGALSCTSLCFLGYWAGNVMLMNRKWSSIVNRLLVYTVVCTLAGAGLCQMTLDEGLIPINKNLWSVSYVLVSAGTSFCLLALLFGLIDVLKIWTGAPLRYPGMNALLIYAGHELLRHTFPVQWALETDWSHAYYLALNAWGALFWTLVGYLLYAKQLFFTV